MRISSINNLLPLSHISLTMAASPSPQCPTRVIANITVPDTPLIQHALDHARTHSTPGVYNHFLRSWLYGTVIASKVPAFQTIDKELHAIAAILHDLGWDPTGALVTSDRRFEVDGADAARAFLRSKAPNWDEHRLQLLWDTIALHTTPSIVRYKEVEVALTGIGIAADFSGPNNVTAPGLTWEEWNGIVETFPRTGLQGEVRGIAVHLCQTKKATTVDNWVSQFGEKYIPGFSLAGERVIDYIEGGVPS